MNEKKNRAVLYYQGQSFIIWQDKNDKWIFTYGILEGVSTQSKDLTTALNLVYETIRDNAKPVKKKVYGKKKVKR